MTAVRPVDKRLSFPVGSRLLRKADFDAVYARAQRLGDGYFSVAVCRNEGPGPRLGMAVGVKMAGNSVGRNRIRRVIRETFRLHRHALPAVDLVVSARPRARDASNAQMRASLEALLHKVRERCASPPAA